MKCDKTADLVNGEEARNKLLYDPYGRVSFFHFPLPNTRQPKKQTFSTFQPFQFLETDLAQILCVGGFGSLNGDMDFWDLTKPDLKKVGKASAFSASYQEWCPDSRHFMACVVRYFAYPFPKPQFSRGSKL